MYNYKIILDHTINIFVFCLFIYIIYDLYVEYQYNKEFKNNNITTHDDFEKMQDNYSGTKLHELYHKLSDQDKEYLYYLINANYLKYKNDKDKFTKKNNVLKTQLIANFILTLLLKGKVSTAVDSLKHNALLTLV